MKAISGLEKQKPLEHAHHLRAPTPAALRAGGTGGQRAMARCRGLASASKASCVSARNARFLMVLLQLRGQGEPPIKHKGNDKHQGTGIP